MKTKGEKIMSVFYGKMNDATQCANHICKGPNTYFGNIQAGDYAFIRLAADGPSITRLWRFNRVVIEQDGSVTSYFDDVFSFNSISIDTFSRLNIFNVGLTFGNKVWKQSKKVGFFNIGFADENTFQTIISNATTFNQYIANQDNQRKIVFVTDTTEAHSNKNIQIVKNNNLYEIYNSEKAFLAELNANFNPNRYQLYLDFLQANPSEQPTRTRKKVKNWLESSGTSEDIGIVHLWDFFCSKQAFKVNEKNTNDEEDDLDNVIDEEDDDLTNEETNTQILDYKNLIIYGIPGCGKSHELKTKYLTSFSEDKIVRTTFHPEYSNTDFIGQVRPIKNGANLDYKVIPGPFSQALCLAKMYPEDKVALVIEEINRGNAAAIFGDLFQLLDRDNNGKSEYDITNEVISSYLKDNSVTLDKIVIPGNLYLYATMNTSDQNVFKLDTAFKRRWEFIRLTNKDTIKDVTDFTVFIINGIDIKWKEFIEVINKVIANNDEISGDRQIGNFFYKGRDNDLKRFANKVLEYIYNDVCKYGGKEEMFNTAKYKTFDDIYDAFVSGENVFIESLFKDVLEAQTSNNESNNESNNMVNNQTETSAETVKEDGE